MPRPARTARYAVLAGMALLLLSGSAEAASVTVVHGVPGLRADVYVNGVKRLDGFAAGSMTSPLRLPAGTYVLALRRSGAPAARTPLLAGRIRLATDTNASIVAHLSPSGRPELTVYRNDVSSLPAGRARVVFRHVAAAPRVELQVDGRVLGGAVASDRQRTAVVPAGDHRLLVRLPGGRSVWGPAMVSLRPGTVYLVYAIGSLKGGTLDQLVQRVADRAAPPRRVTTGTSGLAAVAAWALSRPFGRALDRLLHGVRAGAARPAGASPWRAHRAPLSGVPVVHVVRPNRVTIGGLGIDAPVTGVGVAPDDGGLAVPASASTVAWYRYGGAPGLSGSTVLAAHVDYAGRAGAFYRLGAARRGQAVNVALADGRMARYRIVSLQRYRKAALPRGLFSTTGAPRLVLITCGGRFDPATRHYADNVVVVATPVPR
jgi:hypothetical protein